ncbi:MAG: class I SAM-dependent methyltransferase, partial [Myxococcota bacterium]
MTGGPDRRAVRASYDRAAAGYDRRHAQARSAARFRRIEAPMRAIARAGRVLEIGCGTGRLLAQCSAAVRVGIDLSPGMLERAPVGLGRVCGDAHALPFADASFDAIIAGKGVFRYLDPAPAFRECARVLVAGGRLAVHQYAAKTWSPRRWLSRRFGRGGGHSGHG